jgi:hypothetical protein
MDRAAAEKYVAALMNSALLVDSVYHGGWKRADELTPEERERGAWRRCARQPRPADRKPG